MDKIIYKVITDIDEIEILRDRQVFDYNYNQEEIDSLKEHFVLKDSFYILAKIEHEFAGFCSIDRNWWENNYFFLRQILVNQDFRNHNIGSELMNRCISHAKNCGAIGVVTETAFDNIPMQSLCKKHGFIQWDNPQWKHGVTFKLVF